MNFTLFVFLTVFVLRWGGGQARAGGGAVGGVSPPVNISCPAERLSLGLLAPASSPPSSLFPPSIVILNNARNPVRLSLCTSKASDICVTQRELIQCGSPSLGKGRIGVLKTPPFLQYILISFCSVARDRETRCFELPAPLEVDPAMLVGPNSTYSIASRPETFCETDADCPGEREFCSLLDTGAASVCEFRPCRVTCVCDHILNDFAFGDTGQWIVLDAFSTVCMLLTAFFILYSIRWNRRRAVEGNALRAGVVFPVYYKVMLGLALVYLYDAIAWLAPPLLDWGAEPGQKVVIGALKVLKGGLGEAVIEAIFLFLLQEGAGWNELRAAGYGGALCGLVFGGANFLAAAPELGIHLSKTGCIGYGRPLFREKCWGEIVVNIYTMAVWVLYTFAFCSPYLPCVKWQPQRPAIYRLLFCAIVLRTVDLLILVNSCFDVTSTVLWSIWFQLELYYCFRADTEYFRKPLNIRKMLSGDALSPKPHRWRRESGAGGPRERGRSQSFEDAVLGAADPSLPLLEQRRAPPTAGHRRSASYGSVNRGSPPSPMNGRATYQQRRMKLAALDDILVDFTILKLRRLVARGATSSVHLGSFKDQAVAIKVCSCASLTRKTISDYVREARVLASFNHPNVMRLVGCCIVPPNVWIVTEQCERGNLVEVLRGTAAQTLTWTRRLYLMLGAARGLEHIHSFRFIHGDIKPDNFIVTSDWVVKLADFGEAKEKGQGGASGQEGGDERHRRSSSGAGTLTWLSPERLAPLYNLFLDTNCLRLPVGADNDISQEADIYSFGLTMWEIGSSDIPFKTMDSFTAGQQVLEHDIRPEVSTFPEPFVALLNSCWARDPGVRVTAKDVVRTLEGLQQAGGAV